MVNTVATVTIKYTKQEVVLLINSLTMTCTTQVPTEDDGKWKTPYESLLKDLKRIKQQILDKELEAENESKNTPIEETEVSPGACD